VIIDGKTLREAERHLEGFTGMEKLVNWKGKKILSLLKWELEKLCWKHELKNMKTQHRRMLNWIESQGKTSSNYSYDEEEMTILNEDEMRIGKVKFKVIWKNNSLLS
jgi:hypothetical protein